MRSSSLLTASTVSTKPRCVSSSLVVTTTVANLEFNLETDLAEPARALLARLIAESATQLPSDAEADDELINLTWEIDAGGVNDFEFEHQWARVRGHGVPGIRVRTGRQVHPRNRSQPLRLVLCSRYPRGQR